MGIALFLAALWLHLGMLRLARCAAAPAPVGSLRLSLAYLVVLASHLLVTGLFALGFAGAAEIGLGGFDKEPAMGAIDLFYFAHQHHHARAGRYLSDLASARAGGDRIPDRFPAHQLHRAVRFLDHEEAGTLIAAGKPTPKVFAAVGLAISIPASTARNWRAGPFAACRDAGGSSSRRAEAALRVPSRMGACRSSATLSPR